MDEKIMSQSERIEKFLREHNSDINILSPSKLRQFTKIDDAIQARMLKLEEARKDEEAATINILNIANDTGIARKTFYNNELLKLYVEKYAFDTERPSPQTVRNKAKEKIDDLQEKINKMLDRDIDYAELSRENMKLTSEIGHLKEINDSLRTRLEDKTVELDKAKKNTVKQADVINIPDAEKRGKHIT